MRREITIRNWRELPGKEREREREREREIIIIALVRNLPTNVLTIIFVNEIV